MQIFIYCCRSKITADTITPRTGTAAQIVFMRRSLLFVASMAPDFAVYGRQFWPPISDECGRLVFVYTISWKAVKCPGVFELISAGCEIFRTISGRRQKYWVFCVGKRLREPSDISR